MHLNIKGNVLMVWRLLKVLFCAAVFFLWSMSMLSSFTMIAMLIWCCMGGSRLYYYVRYGRDQTYEEEREWDDWMDDKFDKVLLFPFPQVMGKDLKK